MYTLLSIWSFLYKGFFLFFFIYKALGSSQTLFPLCLIRWPPPSLDLDPSMGAWNPTSSIVPTVFDRRRLLTSSTKDLWSSWLLISTNDRFLVSLGLEDDEAWWESTMTVDFLSWFLEACSPWPNLVELWVRFVGLKEWYSWWWWWWSSAET